MESNNPLGIVFFDFALLVREWCFQSNLKRNEIEFLGQLADRLHNLPIHDLKSDFGQWELRRYLSFLEESINNRMIESDIFLSRYEEQMIDLKKLLLK
ncbi:hypothetical protein [uncultured Enterococcus sp.]|uniref:hypothetical protein n=1 Tax=uncultured Enterococcus sp. TaxID=167972 RepID=UPI002AA86AEF|nr:hypothetical protein [uncultured Enterococcus sp.]